MTGVVERYLGAIVDQDWTTFEQCIVDDVVRIGPFGDTYEGREAYVAFLAELMPTLAGYRMDVDRVVYAAGRRFATAELSETVELDGVPTVTAEGLAFDLADDGRIRRIAIYIRTPAPAPPR